MISDAENSDRSKIFIFDFDGIITYLGVDWKKATSDVKENLGIQISSFLDFFQENWGKDQFNAVSSIVERYEIEAALSAEPFPDVKPALQVIKSAASSRIYIASMQSINVLANFLDKHRLFPYFQSILGRENEGSKEKQLERIARLEPSVIPEKFYFIDDSVRHITTGNNLGFTCTLFNRKNEKQSLSEVVTKLLS